MSKRNWCFTYNNASAEQEGDLLSNIVEGIRREDVVYAIYQRERGEAGTEHLQGYIEFSRGFRLSACKRLLGSDEVHCEARRGTRDQARDYCRKSDTRIGDPVEHGEWRIQGKRSDICAFRDDIEAGFSDKQLLGSHPRCWLAYASQLERVRRVFTERSERPVDVRVFWGVTGAGKSHAAWSFRGFADTYKLASKKPLWFDGYQGESVLFIDEYCRDPEIEVLLEICDKYPYLCPVKGSFKYATWDVVIIATNMSEFEIRCMWPPQMLRRISEWREFAVAYVPVAEVD